MKSVFEILPDFNNYEKDDDKLIITDKPILRSHRSKAFINCFSIYCRNYINYEKFLEWKANPDWQTTGVIAVSMVSFITQYYDFITTAPPSKNRDLDNYCCFNLCEYLSQLTKIPFIISFKKRRFKDKHGIHASLGSEKPLLVKDWQWTHKSILFIDDFITSGHTARTCFEVFHHYKNHVDGLIFCEW